MTPEEDEYCEILIGIRSVGGWLGPNESFKAVLSSDWNTVLANKTTHIELASHLKEVLFFFLCFFFSSFLLM